MTQFCSTTSILGRSWVVRSDRQGQPSGAFTLGDGRVVPPEVVTIVARRGEDDLRVFFEPSLKDDLPDPFILEGMETAVGRLADAVMSGEPIALYGDYDVDGATSSAIVWRYLNSVGVASRCYIPQRMTEGYGPNIPAIELLRDGGASLLVFLDSGTTAFTEVARAREVGLDVIVVDHHEPMEDGSLPDAVVVNPKRIGPLHPLRDLCTAGLAFLLVVGINRELRSRGFFRPGGVAEPRFVSLLGLAALGTVADVVRLRGLNRTYVSLGLKYIQGNPGLRALMSLINEERRRLAEEKGKARDFRPLDYTAESCGYAMGPCINAGGRLDDCMQGVRLLTEDDDGRCMEMARKLYQHNKERRKVQDDIVEQCFQVVSQDHLHAPDPALPDQVEAEQCLVIYDPQWHPGVVGLGASKVKDRFDRPSVVIGTGGKGSGRTPDGFSIGKAFIDARERGLLIKGGGHDAAGGLTIDPSRLAEFRSFMCERASGFQRPPTGVDLVVGPGGIHADHVRAFMAMEPFGMGNREPVVAVVGGFIQRVDYMSGGLHLKARLASGNDTMDLVVFHWEASLLGPGIVRAEGHFVDVIGTLGINEWKGRSYVQMRPDDIMVGAPATALSEAA